MPKPTYLVRKVDEQGEDVVVDAAKFDALLNHMANADPLSKAKEEELIAGRVRVCVGFVCPRLK